MEEITASFATGDLIARYTVKAVIKVTARTQCYRVKSPDGRILFVKLLDPERLSPAQMSDDGTPREIDVARKLNGERTLEYVNHGNVTRNGRQFRFVAYKYLSGKTLPQHLGTDVPSCEFAVGLFHSMLSTVNRLAQLGLAHCAIAPEQVMVLSPDSDDNETRFCLTGWSHCRPFSDSGAEEAQLDGSAGFVAPEIIADGQVNDVSDLYSIGAILYWLQHKTPPTPGKELGFSHPFHNNVIEMLRANQMLLASPEQRRSKDYHSPGTSEDEAGRQDGDPLAIGGDIIRGIVPRRKTGNGFDDVAGMDNLKSQLQSDVIDLLQQPERAQALGLKLPNGMLFYGPPGCGKTFFAEKFAEQAGLNYLYVKCSDIASPYIHGGQTRIAAVFAKARTAAPCIVFLDEIDSMLTSRDRHNNASESGEVNVFLTELNNCGEQGVMVIGATNKPGDIDEAALRAGRLEKKYYIGLPDEETRLKIFELQLGGGKSDDNVDLDRLAHLTEGYISADIKLIVETAARQAFKDQRDRVTMADLERAVAQTPPSLTTDQIKAHEQIRDRFTGSRGKGLGKVGFDTENAQTIHRKTGFDTD